MKTLVWHGCYEKSLSGFIVPDAFQHPAKFSLALIERVYDHMISRGWLKAGDVVGDPFGGVGTGGLVAAYRKLEWVGLELESKFVSLGLSNILFHQDRLKALGAPIPILFQGDSRKFSERVASVVTSPPFAPNVKGGGGINKKGYTSRPDLGPDWVGNRSFQGAGAERDPDNIEKLSEGSVDACISSPPYAAISAGAGGLNTKPAKKPGQQGGRSAVSASQTADQKYGHTEGQISQLKTGSDPIMVGNIVHVDGTVTGVVTSPPYGDTQVAQSPDEKRVGWRGYTNAEGGKKGEAKKRIDCLPTRNTGRGETYWDAMKLVYSQCFTAIKPGGHIAIVVKDYCKDGKVVPLCDDTARLLEHVGFKVIERAHAMLVNETTEGDLFNGTQTKRRERKSFFRRLYEAKGGPRIDFEQVIFACKPS